MKPFIYGSFYDVPRILIVVGTPTYMLECIFDQKKDDYSEFYTVYRIDEFSSECLQGYWGDLNLTKELIGLVRVSDITFDLSRRKMIDMDFLQKCV